MSILIYLIDLAINIFICIVILQVVMSWLINFDVINASNQKAQNLINLLKNVTDPVYKPLQKFIPPIGGIDITPLIVILGAGILKSILISLLVYIF